MKEIHYSKIEKCRSATPCPFGVTCGNVQLKYNNESPKIIKLLRNNYKMQVVNVGSWVCRECVNFVESKDKSSIICSHN